MKDDFADFLQRVSALEKEAARRKKVEEELRASEEWYEALAQLAPVGIFRTDAAGRCVYVNRRWCEIAGLQPDEAQGDRWARALHPDDRQRVVGEWQEAAQKDKLFHSEYRYQTPEGVTTWVVGSASAVRSSSGKLLGYVGTVTDITEQKAAQAALKESGDRLRAVVARMPVLLDAFDEAGNICAWNGECERVTGYRADEAIGNPHFMALLYPDPVYREQMLEAWAERGHDYTEWEWQLTAKDGTVKTIAWSNISKRFPIPGWASWGVGVDVTARNRAERALRERVKELACLYSLSHILTAPNVSEEAMLEQAVQILPQAWQHPEVACARIVLDDREYKTTGFRKTAWLLGSDITVRGAPAGRVEVGYLEPRPEADEGPFLRDERNLIDEVAVRLTKALERRRAEEDRSLIPVLEAKTEELEQFAHTISHDLKTPLITVKGFLNLIQKVADAGDSEKIRLYATQAAEAADRMGKRVKELLELSRLGRLVEPEEGVDLGTLARDAVRMAEGALSRVGVQVEVAPDLPKVCCDAARLREVFENLLDNAAKYMGAQPEPRVCIGSRKNRGETVFFVKDNGRGIASEDRERVFGLFTRLGADVEGTGAGLAIARRIVEAHGGRMWVESDGLGRGATFCLTLGQGARAKRLQKARRAREP